MSDFILLQGDTVIFKPAFGPATVAVQPGTLSAAGGASVKGVKVCVAGDEKQVSVMGCSYVTPVYSVAGVGTLKIQQLMPNQQAQKTKSAKKPVLLKGADFVAAFQVMAPAQMPPPASTPDPLTLYVGNGSFQTMNQKFRGT